MAQNTITYPNKTTGDSFSGAEATEIKTVVNNNATQFDTDVAANAVVVANTAKVSYPGDQTSIVGITGTKAQFDASVLDGNITYDGDPVSVLNNDANYTPSDPTAVTGADQITKMMSLTQAEFDAIGTPDAATLFIITDA